MVAVCSAQTAHIPRMLKPSAFPDLPKAIAAVLDARNCAIPQPSPDDHARNVIRGEFFDKGATAWAVVCSRGGSSSILVFRGENDGHPAEIAKWPDENYFQDGHYSREITAADREFILNHYRAYGGPKPPPIDHQGIDDAFLEKASVTYYWHQGQWRKLTGAD